MEVQGKYVSRDHICIRGEDGYKKHMQIRNNIHNEIWPCPISGCSRSGIGGQRHGNRYIIACTTYEQKTTSRNVRLPLRPFLLLLFSPCLFPLISITTYVGSAVIPDPADVGGGCSGAERVGS